MSSLPESQGSFHIFVLLSLKCGFQHQDHYMVISVATAPVIMPTFPGTSKEKRNTRERASPMSQHLSTKHPSSDFCLYLIAYLPIHAHSKGGWESVLGKCSG